MSTDTMKLIGDIGKNGLFFAVGSGPIAGVRCVTSWEQAVSLVETEDYEGFQLDRQNELSTRVFKTNRQRFNDWNKIVVRIREQVKPLVENYSTQLGDAPMAAVIWDIMSACIELEYGDLVRPDYFGKAVSFYLQGRLPCGWDGAYPSGNFVVY